MVNSSSSFALTIQEFGDINRTFTLQVKWFTKVKDIKDMLHRLTSCLPSTQALFIANSSIPLSQTLTLHDLGIDRAGCTLRLSIISSHSANYYFVLTASSASVEPECAQMLTKVRVALQRQQVPAKTDVLDCTGGVYFMRAVSGKKMAVFKPHDEEQGMPNNPKGYKGNGEHGLREHFKPGFGCMREVAAYLMDVNHFCGVPPTLLVHCEHPILNYPARGHGRSGAMFGPSMYPKMGSLQHFVNANDVFEDLGASVLGDLEVQKIALLDLRLLNCDRNASNILAIHKDSLAHLGSGRSRAESLCDDVNDENQEFDICFDESSAHSKSDRGVGSDRYQLVPIDHGYSLPSKLLINEIDWAWFYYPQVNRPVHEDIKKYVETLDIDTIIATLQQQVTLSEDSLFLIRVAHQLVVDGIAAGLTLFEIASMVARTDEERASSLERAIEEAEENAHRTIEMRIGSVKRGMSPSSTFEEEIADAEGSSTDRFAVSLNGKRHRRIISDNGSERSKDNDHIGASRSVFDDGHEESSKYLGPNSGFLYGHKTMSHGCLTSIRPAIRTSSCNLDSGDRDEGLSGAGLFRNIKQQSFLAGINTGSDEDKSTPESVSSDDGDTIAQHAQRSSALGPQSSNDKDDDDTVADDGGDMFDHFADISTSGLTHLRTNNLPSFNSTSALSHFNAFQGKALRAIQSVDSSQFDYPVSSFKPPAIIAVSSLPMPATSNNNNSSSSSSSNNNSNSNSNIAATVMPSKSIRSVVTTNSIVDKGNDSTDSENSNSSKSPTNDGNNDNNKLIINNDSDSTLTGGKQPMHAPTASRPNPSAPSNSFKRLSVGMPARRPSPLQIGSADPFKHQHHHRNSSSSGTLNLSERAVDFVFDSDGYNANDEEEGSDWFPNSPSSGISPSSIPKPLSFLRVTSFSAFASAPLYDAEGAERRVAKLRKERRRREAGTEEFSRLRTMFTKNAVATLISKAVKAKRVNGVLKK